MTPNAFQTLANHNHASDAMPILFVGHGNPMNAIDANEFRRTWVELGKQLPVPQAILVVSAHWQTRGTMVTAMERPATIHDFRGFPPELFAQEYPAPGAPVFARETQQMVQKTTVELDYDWGLDHGAWSVLLPMFPQATIPVYQLSLDYTKPPAYHYALASELQALRRKGVLIIGSGNIVHNLRMIDFHGTYDWATEFDETMKNRMAQFDHTAIIHYETMGNVSRLAVPTNEHFLPLLYALALQEKDEPLAFFNEKMDLGSISMRSVIIGEWT